MIIQDTVALACEKTRAAGCLYLPSTCAGSWTAHGGRFRQREMGSALFLRRQNYKDSDSFENTRAVQGQLKPRRSGRLGSDRTRVTRPESWHSTNLPTRPDPTPGSTTREEGSLCMCFVSDLWFLPHTDSCLHFNLRPPHKLSAMKNKLCGRNRPLFEGNRKTGDNVRVATPLPCAHMNL